MVVNIGLRYSKPFGRVAEDFYGEGDLMSPPLLYRGEEISRSEPRMTAVFRAWCALRDG